SPPYLNKINARDPKIIAKIGKYNSEFKIQDSKFPPYGRVLLFSVLRVVFGLQNQHPLSEPTPCVFLPYGRVLLFLVCFQNTHAVAWGGATESRGRHRVCRFHRNRQTEIKIHNYFFIFN
ncbi:MAG: hypothetical protein IKK27_01845, partial [Alistipes sp.]|nr:hypothetical protein [Alistipes sp.]